MRLTRLFSEGPNSRSSSLERMSEGAVIESHFLNLGSKLVFSELWTAIWALFNAGLIRHVHPDPAAAVITRLSRIGIAKENADV